MTTRVIHREFVVQPGDDILPPVTLGYAWSSYMNTYAVWPAGAGDSVTIRRSLNLQAGNYYVTGTVDNYGSVNINGQYNINLYNFGDNISRTSVGNSRLVNHQGGLMTIVINATNTGGPRGVAVTISKAVELSGFIYGSGSSVVGDLVWSTRTAGTSDNGRYVATMPFKANITAYAWGSGGGGGGNDSRTIGGLGSPGLYNTTFFQVDKGDLLEVFVGKGGSGGGSNSGGAPGGPAGTSRILINGDSTKSFNGGAGTASGPRPWSGGGGGGGGASGILVNNIPVLVAAGGGGGGGAGNDGNSAGTYARRDAAITKNAIGSYEPGNKIINLAASGSYTYNVSIQVNQYTNYPGLTAPPAITGTLIAVTGFGSIPANQQTRILRSNSKINLASSSVLTYWVNRGTASNWGQTPDNGEDLFLDYSTDNTTWINLDRVGNNIAQNVWLIRSPQIPAGAKVAGGVFLRFRQPTQAASSTGKRDTWAFTDLYSGSPILDYRGENGQTKGGDGGGAGGAGGGYPGGQGGAVFGGDASGFAGQCGGNYPDNVSASTGTNTSYYKAGFAAGGDRTGGNGQNGRVFLVIEPISLMSVNVAGAWKQITEGFVKVSGSWQDIDTVYIKIDDVWREINGAGQGDVTLAGNTQNYGTSTRSFS